MSERIFITGASGYVGAMLAHRFESRPDVEALLLLDKEPESELTKNLTSQKTEYLQANLGESGWEEKVRNFAPTVIIHAAWQIREMYGKQDMQWKWNIEGSDRVFDLAFTIPSVKKLIHFSTVASYGAYPENTIEHRFKESEPFRPMDYLYAEEKRIAESHLEKKYKESNWKGDVYIVRPAAITGPRGRYDRVRFGLQSALSGSLKKSDSIAYRFISYLVSWVPVTKKWLRQFIHEDDVYGIVELLTFQKEKGGVYEAFNICPPGDVVLGPDMAKAVGKKTILVPPILIRVAFFFMWHLTRGKIPTSRGGWKSYSFPIAVDGSKITQMFGYEYKHGSKDSFVENKGFYAK